MKEKDKERLNQFISFEIKSVQKQILDVCELIIPSSNWNPFRKKILDITNDSRRKLEAELQSNYVIEYTPSNICEDVVQVRNSKVYGKTMFINNGEDKENE